MANPCTSAGSASRADVLHHSFGFPWDGLPRGGEAPDKRGFSVNPLNRSKRGFLCWRMKNQVWEQGRLFATQKAEYRMRLRRACMEKTVGGT